MATYYVSNNGDDNNNGLTPQTAWRSINKVKTFGVKSGDAILFKCGDTFYGTIFFGVNFTSPVTLSSYGEGDKPKISCYKIANDSSGWVLDSTNIYKYDLSGTGTYTGNRDTWDTNVGFLKVDNSIKGVKKFNKADLSNQWEFFNDNKFVFVYSTQNPTSLATDIKIAVNADIITINNNLIIKDLEIVGTGKHGINGTANDCQILNNDIHEIGGSLLPNFGDGMVRYGNGIQLWDKCSRNIMENNQIYDVYDVAYTMQGGSEAVWEDNVYRNNVDWNCNQSFEVWAEGTQSHKGFFNCIYEDNISINAGFGWGFDVRPDQQSDVSILIAQMQTPNIDIKLKGNIFYNPRGAVYFGEKGNQIIPNGIKSDYNYIFLREDQRIHKFQNFTVEQHEDFKQSTGKEINSHFFVITEVAEEIGDVISNISSYIGTNNSTVKQLTNFIGRLNSRIKDISINFVDKSTVSKTTNGVEIQHNSGYLKYNGGYISNQTGTSGSFFTRLGKIILKASHHRFDMVMDYMICGDSSVRGGMGTIDLQIIPNGSLTGATVYLKVLESLPFTKSLTKASFIAVVEKANGSEIEVGLYIKIGDYTFGRLAFQPKLIYSAGANADNYTFYSNQSLITSLPSGTQTVGS